MTKKTTRNIKRAEREALTLAVNAKGSSYAAVAARIGVAASSISRMISGRNKKIRTKTQEALKLLMEQPADKPAPAPEPAPSPLVQRLSEALRGGNSPEQSNPALARIEAKVDALMAYLGVEL